MWSYILKRCLLMIPTGIGVITVFFVVSEFVPGGPLDQVESMIIEQANQSGAGDLAAFGQGDSAGAIKIDPEMRMQIKRKLGLNHDALDRYLRMLLWFSRDSMMSSKEVEVGAAQKVSFRDQSLWVYRTADGYHVFRNSYALAGAPGAVRFDQPTVRFVSTLDETVQFDPLTGQQVDGALQLEAVPVTVRAESFWETEYLANGERRRIREPRDEVYHQEGAWQALTNGDNWHGLFLFKFPVSITKNKKCYALIRERLPISMRLGVSSFFITYTLCILLGIAKAVRNGSAFDSATSVLILIGYGIPGFVLAVFLIKAFGPSGDSWVSVLPLRGIQSPPEIYNTLTAWGKFWDNVHHMIAPVLCLTIQSFAGLTMLTKNSVLEQFQQLYAVAARARGLSKRKVLIKHVLRNSLIPLVTGFPARFVMMFFAGSVLIEKIFSLDGLGLLSYTALIERDYPLIISNMFIFTFIGLACRLLSDIGYVIVDPRISFEGKKF
jgi:microcin C transport system permease protein